MTDSQSYVLVGAAVAGARAAEALRGAGVEGPITLVGEERDPPYERPPLSKGFLAGDAQRADLQVLPADWYAQNDVELMLGRRVTSIDRAGSAVELDGGQRLAYDRLLLATGSSPRKLDIPGNDLDGVLYLRRVGHSEAIREAIAAGGPMVVVGGGWIGLEVGAVARTKGVDVTLLETQPTPLYGVVGQEVGERFTQLHRDHGMDVRTGAQPLRAIRGSGKVEGVELGDGTVIPAAAVVVGVGIRPRTELAEAAGLPVDNGVLVDATLRTEDPRIWAAGDVANAVNDWVGDRLRVEHFANANDQGPFVGRSMAGSQERWAMPPFFWSDQYDVGLEYRGWADPRSSRVVLRGKADDGVWMAFWLDNDGVRAGLHVNAWDDAGEVKRLVVDRAKVDPDRLADPSVGWDAVRA
jgi:3-phenylpropionate/trans-cinnamate dioxygenase ferredoxin reductase subunit